MRRMLKPHLVLYRKNQVSTIAMSAIIRLAFTFVPSISVGRKLSLGSG